MRAIVWIVFAVLAVFGPHARAESTTYIWDAPTQRIDGSPISGRLTYDVRHNDAIHATAERTITLPDYPAPGSESCIRAIEHHNDEGLQMWSEWGCITVQARPMAPNFRILQLIE